MLYKDVSEFLGYGESKYDLLDLFFLFSAFLCVILGYIYIDEE